MFIEAHPAELRALPGEYHELYARLIAFAPADERVLRVWLSGSLGRGIADAGSDLDVVIEVADEAFDAFAEGWREWLAQVTPTVLARALPGLPGSWYSLTPKCARFDAVVIRARARGQRAARAEQRLVFDRTAAADGGGSPPSASTSAQNPDPGPDTPAAPAAQAIGPGPDPARLLGLVEEFLRQQAIFHPSVVAREDWLLGVIGVQQVHMMLYQLFVESNQPLPPSGVKQWSAKLTDRQRRRCAGLRLPGPTGTP